MHLAQDEANRDDKIRFEVLGKAKKNHNSDCIPNVRFSLAEDARKNLLKFAAEGVPIINARQTVIDDLIRTKKLSHEEIAKIIPPKHKMASAYSKAASHSLPNNILTSANVEIPARFQRARFEEGLDNVNSLISQVELGSKAVWVFARSDMLEILFNSKKWLVDGIFSIPAPFKKLVSIHAKHLNSNVCIVYGFLPDKQKDSYDALVKSVLNCQEMVTYEAAGKQIQVKSVSSDFEPIL